MGWRTVATVNVDQNLFTAAAAGGLLCQAFGEPLAALEIKGRVKRSKD